VPSRSIGDVSTPVLPSIAFFEPRIPENTGSTIRLSAVTGAPLRLIEPLGFDLSEPKLRRAGLDYHDLATVTVHPTLDALLDELPQSRVFAFTASGALRYSEIEYQASDILLFGPEPTGLPEHVLAHSRVTERVRIPMLEGRRSLNLANAAAIAVYEAARQLGFTGQV